jgi:hypothetical protein
MAQAARDCGLQVVVAKRARADDARLEVEGFSVIAIASRRGSFSSFRSLTDFFRLPRHRSSRRDNPLKSLYRRSLSNVYAGIVNLISGFRPHYYKRLAVHLRYNVMRWHPNARGFGLQAGIICMLLDEGFSYRECPLYPWSAVFKAPMPWPSRTGSRWPAHWSI